MSDGGKLILSPYTGRKKQKAWNKTREKYMPVKKKTDWNRQGIILQWRGWLEVFLNGKGAFFNVNESDDSYNDDDNYNENNEQQQLS